jgi:DNA-binding protein YbaB
MTAEMHPQVAEALQQAQRFQSTLEDQIHRTTTESFTGTDEAKTVSVTIDGQQSLTGLHIEEGLLRLGADTVEQRINEAIQNAVATATGAGEAEQEKMLESLAEISGALIKSLGLS